MVARVVEEGTPRQTTRLGFKFLSDTQTGELQHRLNMRPCGSVGAVRRLAACCVPARGTAVTAPLVAPVIPSGPAPYG
jgi:hypothetical protein